MLVLQAALPMSTNVSFGCFPSPCQPLVGEKVNRAVRCLYLVEIARPALDDGPLLVLPSPEAKDDLITIGKAHHNDLFCSRLPVAQQRFSRTAVAGGQQHPSRPGC